MRTAAKLSRTANAQLRLRPKDADADGAAHLRDKVRLRLRRRARPHATVVATLQPEFKYMYSVESSRNRQIHVFNSERARIDHPQ
eukprot:3731165-Prymnesium_polylepis.1